MKKSDKVKIAIMSAIAFIITLNVLIAVDCDGKVVKGLLTLECINGNL